MTSQKQKGELFKALHERPGCFVIPNPWDAGSAKLLTNLGYEALATTSAGLAFMQGRSDGKGFVCRDEAFSNARDIVAATDLPVSADLENGYHIDPADIFDTYRLAGETGIVGASIEDASGNVDDPIYPFGLALDRVAAACEAVKAYPYPFVLTARAENFLYGRQDLADTIRRLQAYQQAGADVLFAPGLSNSDDIAAVVSSLDKPVNVVMGLSGSLLTVAELTEIGVRRISLGSSLSRAALGELLRAAVEVKDQGTFSFSESAVSYAELNEAFKKTR